MLLYLENNTTDDMQILVLNQSAEVSTIPIISQDGSQISPSTSTQGNLFYTFPKGGQFFVCLDYGWNLKVFYGALFKGGFFAFQANSEGTLGPIGKGACNTSSQTYTKNENKITFSGSPGSSCPS